mmetsp:Transcript_18183/g.41266  ORF Transcript_18183/g.41266 Transcript_18183/m.41266 type:complete len:245 (-) Transcript_18183:818-1552(-)
MDVHRSLRCWSIRLLVRPLCQLERPQRQRCCCSSSSCYLIRLITCCTQTIFLLHPASSVVPLPPPSTSIARSLHSNRSLPLRPLLHRRLLRFSSCSSSSMYIEPHDVDPDESEFSDSSSPMETSLDPELLPWSLSSSSSSSESTLDELCSLAEFESSPPVRVPCTLARGPALVLGRSPSELPPRLKFCSSSSEEASSKSESSSSFSSSCTSPLSTRISSSLIFFCIFFILRSFSSIFSCSSLLC